MVRRKEFFQRYARDAGLDADRLAVQLMLSPARIRDLLSGRAPISNELATHIEEMLQLPASWLDQGGTLASGASPMIDAPVQAPSIAAEAQPTAPYAPASQAATVAQPGVVAPAVAVADKKLIHEHRRLNLTMLTAERGTKNRLARLAGTSGSRISLMTSARKPVSDPFAFAIEDGLGLPRGWLDQPRSPDSIPAAVWQSLKVDGTAPSATSGPLVATPTATPTATPAPPAGPGRPRQPAATQRATSGAAVVPTTVRSAVSSTAAITEASSASAPAPTTSAPTAPTQPAPVSLPTSGTGLFDKPAGQCGPIAEALAKTVLNLSATDKLSEARALQFLGILISETSTSR